MSEATLFGEDAFESEEDEERDFFFSTRRFQSVEHVVHDELNNV